MLLFLYISLKSHKGDFNEESGSFIGICGEVNLAIEGFYNIGANRQSKARA
jgi:hypothetical protein